MKSDTIYDEIINNYDAKSKKFLETITYTIEEKLYTLLPEV